MVACGSSRNASKPATFFHGSASPIQIRSAPAAASARTMAWPTDRLAVGDQDFAPARIAGHFAQLRIVRQIRPPLFRHGDQRRLPGAVERRFDAHAARRRADAFVQIGNDIDAGVEANNADAPRQPLAKE